MMIINDKVISMIPQCLPKPEDIDAFPGRKPERALPGPNCPD